MKKILCMVLLCMILAAAPLTAWAKTYEAKVYSSRMNVYSTTSTAERYYLGYLKKGVIFTVHDVKGDWAKVSYQGKRGFALFKDIIMRERHLYYVQIEAPVYTQASSSSQKIMTLPVGTEVYAVGKSGNYWLVQNKNGSMTAYIQNKYIGTTKPTAKPTAKSTATPTTKPTAKPTTQPTDPAFKPLNDPIETAVHLALEQLDKPYSPSSNPPKSFDCATLVYYCYRKAGIKVNDSAYSIGYDHSMARIDEISDLQIGDIVCFNTNEDEDDDVSDHVGIYIGNNEFIHASSAKGVVMISKLADYYARNFSWGLRPNV